MSIGINLRVTGHTSIGGRKYQEDFFSVAYQQAENDQSLEYAFFGIYDGHGGAEASLYAKEHLMNTIVSQKLFWSENDDDVLKAIREGYIQTHYSMWREQDKWPKTSSGLPSTAGTTASIAFIRRGKIYIGHVGDSGIVLGYQKEEEELTGQQIVKWAVTPLTEDHKPEAYAEKMRIMSCGGKVVTKSGVPRVVWNRPRIGHKGPVRRSTPIDEIPFLAVARSLGDLWSYNSAVNDFVVSPNPDVSVIEIDPKKYKCLIFGTDGLWNVLSPKHAVEIVHAAEMDNIRITLEGGCNWKNPSKLLVNEALERWSRSNMKADNTSVVIIMLDPPGPPLRDVLRSMKTHLPQINYETSYAQPLDHTKITLYDHTTRESIDLSQVTCQETLSENEQNQQYLESTASTSYQDTYTNSFAESYKTFLGTGKNDHACTNYTTTQQYTLNHHLHHQNQNQHVHVTQQQTSCSPVVTRERNSQDLEDTYSLTNLQTKSERIHSEMMEASTSLPSDSLRQSHLECTGNVAIIENFHDYPLPHMPSHQLYDIHYQESPFQQEEHHEQPTYQMERFDYRHPQQQDQVGCSYTTQQYTAHDLSEHSYQRDALDYLYPVTDEHICNTAEKILECELPSCSLESRLASNEFEQTSNILRVRVDRQSNTSCRDEEGIQINEISSSSLAALTQDCINFSDSDSCASGDETKASSSTYSGVKKNSTTRNSLHNGKDKNRMKNALKHIVKIVYETRSSHRTRCARRQQENRNTNTRKSIPGKFGNILSKTSGSVSLLTLKKTKQTVGFNKPNDNSRTVISQTNNNKNLSLKGIKNNGSKIPVEKRVLRSTDLVKSTERTLVKRSLRKADCITILSTSTHKVGTKSKLIATEVTRKLPMRKVLLRKVTLSAKRTKRR
ncbi:uncharacterized protein LOC131427976 [Malaya genurostris]|uniref:uncharacterized protein LOC131427976 n=1 Tax=Malaya genurostris TaxID=325434 RepID=UPI0026F3D5F1|nr:uncharacterized protein LOC131427976 [Malaya genurostris]